MCNGGARLALTPEPSTLLLLGLGAANLRKKQNSHTKNYLNLLYSTLDNKALPFSVR
jgi:hypothetical protein